MSSIYIRMGKDSYFRMGYIYQVSGDLQAAADCYIRSIESGPNPEAHTFLGWVLSMMGQVDSAIEECKKALELDPNFGNAWNDLGAYFTEKREYDKAIPYLKRASKCKNYDSREFPHYNLARIYIQKEMLVLASKELQKALKFNPAFIPAKELFYKVSGQLH